MKSLILILSLFGGMLLTGCERHHDKDEAPHMPGALLPGGDVKYGVK